ERAAGVVSAWEAGKNLFEILPVLSDVGQVGHNVCAQSARLFRGIGLQQRRFGCYLDLLLRLADAELRINAERAYIKGDAVADKFTESLFSEGDGVASRADRCGIVDAFVVGGEIQGYPGLDVFDGDLHS